MFQGQPTRRLRRSSSKKREDAYCDLYVASVEERADGQKCCTYYCCITGCTKSAVSMYIGGPGNKNKVVFTNFFKHLQNHHAEYLFEQDRTCLDVRPHNENTVQHFFPPTRPIGGQSQSSPDIATRVQERVENSQSKKLFNKIAQATAEVVAHGPYPISLLQNKAMEEYLVRLEVASEGFLFPSRRTVGRRLDELLVEEDKKQTADLVQTLDFYCVGWDEWTSKQNLNYMSLNITGIPPDFSCLRNFMVAVSYFPYPHCMSDIRLKVLGLIRRVLPSLENADIKEGGELESKFKEKVFSVTYDGAASNYAFSPDPLASGLSALERADRRATNRKYDKIEEMRCLCHRLIKILEHAYKDPGNAASDKFTELMEAIFGFFNLISASQKNEQELRRLQESDADRKGSIKVDIGVPSSRWNYNCLRIRRCMEIRRYAFEMISQTAETEAQQLEWLTKKLACERSMTPMELILPMLVRVHTWIVYLQNAVTPTISLVLYIMEDLIQVSDDLAESADRAGSEEAEMVLSRIQAELKADFEGDLTYDYFKLAQLFDPRVCHRTQPSDIVEIDRLLQLAYNNYRNSAGATATGANDASDNTDDSDDDIFGSARAVEDYSAEISVFKAHMRKIRTKKGRNEDGTNVYEYFGGVERQEDIDIFEFYKPIVKSIPTLIVIIRKILSHPSATVDNERVFNIAGNVLNIRRCSLKPVRAEKLILSAFRYRCERRNKQPPRLPSFATFDDSDTVVDPEDDNNLDEVRHIAPSEREVAAAWEALFTDDDDDDDDAPH